LIILQKIDKAAEKDYRVRYSCGNYLRESNILGHVLKSLLRCFPLKEANIFMSANDVPDILRKLRSVETDTDCTK